MKGTAGHSGVGESRFVKPVPKHPGRFVPAEEADRQGIWTGAGESRFVRQVEVEAAPFVVGMDEFAEVEEKKGWWRRDGLPPRENEAFTSAPFEVERYIARVDDVSEGDQIVATVWEVPNGRSGTAAFSKDDTTFEPEMPEPGAFLWVWVWSEARADGTFTVKKLVRVENVHWTTEQDVESKVLPASGEEAGGD